MSVTVNFNQAKAEPTKIKVVFAQEPDFEKILECIQDVIFKLNPTQEK